jgi:hypothetical protein
MKHFLQFALSLFVLIAVGVALSSCGSKVEFVRQDMTPYPPRPDNAPIEIHRGTVSRPHVVIGTMIAEKTIEATLSGESTYDEVMDWLMDHGRKVGADALIEVHPVNPDFGGLKSKLVMSAVAIRYLEPAGTVTSQ